jgi:hypothetical protein
MNHVPSEETNETPSKKNATGRIPDVFKCWNEKAETLCYEKSSVLKRMAVPRLRSVPSSRPANARPVMSPQCPLPRASPFPDNPVKVGDHGLVFHRLNRPKSSEVLNQ